MTGKPGRSGGKREGSGRKPSRFALKIGDRINISTRTADDHFLPMEMATVIEIDRKILIVELDTGDRLTIRR